MAKRRKKSKPQKRKNCQEETQPNAGRRASLCARKRRTEMVAKAKPKRAAVGKAVRRMKQAVAPAIETVVVDVVEEPVSGAITVTEVEGTRRIS